MRSVASVSSLHYLEVNAKPTDGRRSQEDMHWHTPWKLQRSCLRASMLSSLAVLVEFLLNGESLTYLGIRILTAIPQTKTTRLPDARSFF